ncbi:hypothetical protein C0J45_8311 [Silurus meridionalis]|nr:hypothetical protein C0J45_8311 [Silurus meridionalis]
MCSVIVSDYVLAIKDRDARSRTEEEELITQLMQLDKGLKGGTGRPQAANSPVGPGTRRRAPPVLQGRRGPGRNRHGARTEHSPTRRPGTGRGPCCRLEAERRPPRRPRAERRPRRRQEAEGRPCGDPERNDALGGDRRRRDDPCGGPERIDALGGDRRRRDAIRGALEQADAIGGDWRRSAALSGARLLNDLPGGGLELRGGSPGDLTWPDVPGSNLERTGVTQEGQERDLITHGDLEWRDNLGDYWKQGIALDGAYQLEGLLELTSWKAFWTEPGDGATSLTEYSG